MAPGTASKPQDSEVPSYDKDAGTLPPDAVAEAPAPKRRTASWCVARLGAGAAAAQPSAKPVVDDLQGYCGLSVTLR